jgi:hypothetical protein
MDTIDLKEEIKQMIDSVDDPAILQSIRELLFPEEANPIYRENLISGAIKSEEDIKAGKVYSEREFFQESKDFFSSQMKLVFTDNALHNMD